MSDLIASPSIRSTLRADAAVSAAAGLVLLAGGGLAAGLSRLPEPLLRGAGLALLPFAAAVFWLARRPAPEPRAVKAVIALNLSWIVASLLLLVSDWGGPTSLGKLFVIAQPSWWLASQLPKPWRCAAQPCSRISRRCRDGSRPHPPGRLAFTSAVAAARSNMESTAPATTV